MRGVRPTRFVGGPARPALLACAALTLLAPAWRPGALAQPEPPQPEAAPPEAAQPEPAPSEPPPSEAPPPEPAPAPAAAPARDPVAGEQVVVIMKDGQRYSGEFVGREGGAVVVRIAGVAVTIPAADVQSVVVQRPLRERYRELRSLIDDGDVPALVQLAEWLRVNALLDEALAELDHVLRVDPTNAGAARMRELTLRQIDLRDRAPASPSGRRPAEPTPRDDEAAPLPDSPADFPLLTDEQVNLMKVYELDLSDPPRMLVSRETIERLLQRYADHPLIPSTREGRDAFLALPAKDIVDLMFRVQARDLYGEVRVQGQPASMRRFTDHVSRLWMANNCSSAACHGGDKSGDLRLFNRATGHERTVYTNFLILERFRMRDGRPLIDYDKPEASPLLQLGLPRADSSVPHPEVRGWTPAFRSREDRRFRQAVEWIRSMYQPRPDYPIEYDPPRGEPAGSSALGEEAPATPNRGEPR